MGIPVMILGASGSGKSTSLRNFPPDEIGIFNVASKPLPFRGGKDMKVANGATYSGVTKSLEKNTCRAYAIDDSQYLMAFEMFDKAKEKGYNKFTDMAQNFYNLIQTIINNTTPDTIVYFLHHTEEMTDGHLKAKTIGKMLDEKLTVEGLFSIVLYCYNSDQEHYFITQSDGTTTAKSPMEMFPLKIDNDLKVVDTAIREYYGLNGGNKNESN